MLIFSALVLAISSYLSEIERTTVQSSVKIYNVAGSTAQAGSGTIVKIDYNAFYVLGCYHVIDGPDEAQIVVVIAGGKKLNATLQWCNAKRDLAYLRVPTTDDLDICVATIATNNDNAVGQQVFKSGYPRAGNRQTTYGVITNNQFFREDGVTPLLTAKIVATNGDSGGGVFRAEDGHLIGVLTGGHPGMGTISATTLADVQWFLKKIESKNRSTAYIFD